jgi:threonine/homoserine/homoserine lactone efflux protein
LAKGFIAGLAVSAPLGPVGLICLRSSAGRGRLQGFIAGVGATTADVIYAAFVVFGFSRMTEFLLARQGMLRAAGGFALFFIGLRLMVRKNGLTGSECPYRAGFGLFTYGFVTTLSNPATLVGLAVILAGLGYAGTARVESLFVLSGIAAGCLSWWLMLSVAGGGIERDGRLSKVLLSRRLIGAVISAFGVALLTSSLTDLR